MLAEKLYVTTTQAVDMDMQLILAAAGPRIHGHQIFFR